MLIQFVGYFQGWSEYHLSRYRRSARYYRRAIGGQGIECGNLFPNNLRRWVKLAMNPIVWRSVTTACLLWVGVWAASAGGDDRLETAVGPQSQQRLATSDGGEMDYLLHLPPGDQPQPLLLFLHGRGESRGPLSLVAKWGPPRMIARGEMLPFIVVSPQCPAADQWSSATQQRRLVELLDHIMANHPVDGQRVYLTGLSMGGYGSWTLAAAHPERFAAVVPICGGGRVEDAFKLVEVPIWTFHGDQDAAVPLARSVEMVEAIQASGGKKIRFTKLEHVGHNSWSSAYALPDLYAWMLQQKLPH